MDLQHYKNYTADDFILDDDFREMVSNAAPDERFDEFINSLPEKRAEILLAAKLIRNLKPGEFHQSEERKKELWQQIEKQQGRQKYLVFLRYAASVLLIAGLGSLGYFAVTNLKQQPLVAETGLPEKDALLILANGKTVSISSKQSTIQYSEDGSGIVVNDSSGVEQSFKDEALNQLIVPYGKRTYLVLSEGTKVWLNSGSKLVFPPAFKGKTREVVLVGEAMFDVSKDNSKPFIVKTDEFNLKVYGTKFDVQAYRQDNNYHVVLVEGKVSMNRVNDKLKSEVFLEPNQKATLVKGETDFEIANVDDIELYTAWVDGYLNFSNEQLDEILKRVARYYNVEIEVDNSVDSEAIYGKLDLKEDLERVLDGIAFISKTTYTKQGNKYIFKTN